MVNSSLNNVFSVKKRKKSLLVVFKLKIANCKLKIICYLCTV